MKKIITILMALLFVLSGIRSVSAYQIKADARTKRIPMGTKLELEAANTVTTESLNKGDMFSAYLTKDIYSDGSILLPRGTVIRGNASNVLQAKRLSKSAVLYLNFDHIVAPNGKQIPIRAGIKLVI